jgi:catechol 2,3-dioxygenase-like lactoylglutathione lyase family enzyme
MALSQPLEEQETSKVEDSTIQHEYDASIFTGEFLPVFYVKDVLKSLEFYRDKLGFKFHHFYDYDKGQEVVTWEKDEPPAWALLSAGGFEFALHRASNEYEQNVGGARYYFRVHDVRIEYDKMIKRGVEVSKLYERPWMVMFYVVDPDGRIIFFQTPPEELK